MDRLTPMIADERQSKAREMIDIYRVMTEMEREYFDHACEDINNKTGQPRAEARRRAEQLLTRAIDSIQPPAGHSTQ